MVKGIETGSGGVCCHDTRGCVRNKSDPDVLFTQARVHCDNKPRQIGLSPDYNMTLSIIKPAAMTELNIFPAKNIIAML